MRKLSGTVSGLALIMLTAGFGATRAEAAVTYYNTFANFSAAATGLATETFAAIDPGANTFAVHNLPINSTNDPGLLAGFSISTSGSLGLFVGGAGALGIGNTTPDIFGNQFGSTETLSFTTNPKAVGFQLFGYSTTETETVDVFGTSGLLSSTTVTAGLAPVYLGIVSDETITSITLIPGDGTHTVGIANLSFGQAAAVPEPASALLIGVPVAATMLARRRKSRTRDKAA